jgi:hypothetical protein
MPSSLTTVPRWHPYAPEGRGDEPLFPRSPQSRRGSLSLYVKAANLPWWFDDYLSAELNRLFALPARWDGFSADEITLEAIQQLVAILVRIVGESSPAPQFFPLPDGGIQAEWHVGGNDIEVEVDAAGDAYVLATRSNDETVADGEVGTGRDDPAIEAVATFLNELSERLSLAH